MASGKTSKNSRVDRKNVTPNWAKQKEIKEVQAKLDKLAQEKEVAEILAAVKEQQAKVEVLLTDVQNHYNADNIAMRDKWMLEVNTTMHWARERAKVYDASVGELTELGSS